MHIRLFAVILLALSLTLAVDAGAARAQTSLPDFTQLVEQQSPAVVNISTTKTVKQQGPGMLPFDENDPAFQFFFKHFGPPQQPNGRERQFKNHSLGSGFIVSNDGLILTNAHVVDAADEVLVRLSDKREFKAKVLGTDRRTDVALIKINANSLPVVKIGDPAKLKVGEWVIAIGSPFGFDHSVTAGIVSAKGRSLPDESYVPFIQTDAAINPGNSGGPLFNMKGEVIGINSQIYSRSGGYQGIAFSIPIDVAMEVQTQLRASGKVIRGRIGVVIQEVTRELADSFGLAKPQGALVANVEKGGPADKAGVKAGDIILKFDGKPVNESGDLPRMVGNTKPGTKSVLQVWRKNSAVDLTIAVGEMPGENIAKSGGKKKEEGAAVNRLGVVLSVPNAEQMKQLEIDHGLLVEDASDARFDLRAGDVLLALIHKGAQTDLKSVEQFNALLAKIEKNASLTLLVRRGDSQIYVTLKNPGEK